MPPVLRRWWPALIGLSVVGAVFLLPLAGRGTAVPGPRAVANQAVVAVATPTPAGVAAVPGQRLPEPGEARFVAGPFTDRLALRTLTFRGGTVGGRFGQVADNSAVIVLEVQGDFYDDKGTLLGSRKTVLRQPDIVRAAQGGVGPQRYGGDIPFTVRPAAGWAARVSGVLVSVPTLVNE